MRGGRSPCVRTEEADSEPDPVDVCSRGVESGPGHSPGRVQRNWNSCDSRMEDERIEICAVGPHDRPRVFVYSDLREIVWVVQRCEDSLERRRAPNINLALGAIVESKAQSVEARLFHRYNTRNGHPLLQRGDRVER